MKIQDVVCCAAMASFTAVLGLLPPIMLPIIPVPITVQTLGVMLAGSILGAQRGFFSLLIFLVLTLVGVPTLAGAMGGLPAFFLPSAGFLLAWPLGAYVVGLCTEYFWPRLNLFKAILSNFLGGVVVLYCIGIPWLAISAHMTLAHAAIASLIFVPGDIIKVGLAAWTALIMKRSYPMIHKPVLSYTVEDVAK